MPISGTSQIGCERRGSTKVIPPTTGRIDVIVDRGDLGPRALA